MKVVIERFKNIELFDLEISGISLLVGGNNSGKSSVLQAIQFGIAVAQTTKMQGGVWRKDRLSTSIGQSDLVYSPIKDVLSLARNGKLMEVTTKSIRITYFDNDQEARVTVRKGRNKNILLEILGQQLGEKLQSMESPFCALVTGLAGIPSEEALKTNIVIRKAAAKGDSNSVFRNILLQLMSNHKKWEQFHKQIESIFPGYAIEVTFNQDIDEAINCIVKKSGVIYPIDSCGTGILQAIQIFSYINLFEPKILLLDEPDSHLHPNNQKQLARELKTVSNGGLNIIIASHSKHLVEALIDSSDFVWLLNGSRQPNVEKYDLKALLNIGALNVGERLGKPKYIFLTEDENCDILKIMLASNGYDLKECEIAAYSGCTQIRTAIILLNYLRKSCPNTKYIIHRDRDFLELQFFQDYEAQFNAMGVKVFIPDGNDLESYFSKPAHIATTCGITGDQAKEIIQAAYVARRKELIEKYVNTRIENLKKNGKQVNAGQISVECDNLMTGPNSIAIHGKILLKGIRDELRLRSIADRIMSNSDMLRSEKLQKLWQE